MITENSRRISAEKIRSIYFIEDAWRDENLPGEPKKLCKSPFREDNNASFSVFDEGRKFKDHATNQGGDVIEFVKLANQCSFREALETIASRLGYNNSGFTVRKKLILSAKKPKPTALKSIPSELKAIWDEGADYLMADDERMIGIDQWRGWQIGTTEDLCLSGFISFPKIKGKRVLSFIVHKIENSNELICGFHSYYGKDKPDLPTWMFYPNQRLHQQSVSPLPFIIGGGHIENAEVLIITEGQWDCISIASHAGWLGEGMNFPEKISIIGIRGAGNWRQFLNHYKFPLSVSILVIPDCDDAGLKWESTFVPELKERSAKVRWAPPVEGDFSDITKKFNENVSDSFFELLKGL